MALDEFSPGQPSISIRGVSAYDGPPSPSTLLCSLACDVALGVMAVMLAVNRFALSPVPRLSGFLWVLAVFGSLWIVQYGIFKGTLGQWIWRLRFLDERKQRPRFPLHNARLHQHVRLDGLKLLSARALTLAIVLAALGSAVHNLQRHPLLMSAEIWELSPHVPDPSDANWGIIPYFYTMGAWPKSFEGNPILYSLPYEKGPPTRFIGHIIAHWDRPDTRVTIEGPLTTTLENPYSIRECVTGSRLKTLSPRCLKLREMVLERHLAEMRQLDPSSWTLKWFEIKNLALPAHESPIGVYLSASSEKRAQERFVFINARGVNQTFVLDFPHNRRGELARETFHKALRSQKLSIELNSGRAWIDRRLAGTRLGDLDQLTGSDEFVPRLAEVHALLLSKISVEPKTFDAYYHLAGTSLMLAKHAYKRNNSDWTAIAKPMVLSSYRYAQDIAPKDQRTTQIESIWLDAKKY